MLDHAVELQYIPSVWEKEGEAKVEIQWAKL